MTETRGTKWGTGFCAALMLLCSSVAAHAQSPANTPATAPITSPASTTAAPSATNQPAVNQPAATSAEMAAAAASVPDLWSYKGLHIDAVEFNGVTIDADDPLRKELDVEQGKVLDPDAVRQTVRRLYQTGLYRSLSVHGVRQGDSIELVFAGTPRYFVGRVTVDGPKQDRMVSLLQYSTQLNPGSPYVASQKQDAIASLKQTLAQNGYQQPIITETETYDDVNALIDLTFHVVIGPRAKIGSVSVEGNPGMTLEEFRKKSKLKEGKRVTRDTTSDALTRLRKYYQKNDRLEAEVALKDSKYTGEPTRRMNYTLNAERGPLLTVEVRGEKISKSRLKQLLPIYEESAVDNDLLNEGAHNIGEYLQRQGFFDATVDPHVDGQGTDKQTVVFVVNKGRQYKVTDVQITGNKYFDTDTLRERMQVVKSDLYVRNGRYSQALLQNDVDSIVSLYRANGFTEADVKTSTEAHEGKKGAELVVKLKVVEGQQQKFGAVTLTGVDTGRTSTVRGMMNTIEGQPFSLNTVSGDRDTVLQYYLAQGFSNARVEVKQKADASDTSRTNITFVVSEGEEVFVNKVLVSGAKRTRPALVNKQLMLKPGDPLDQSALVEMQRKYYDLAVFNEANVAVQNPDGMTDRKNVLVQLTEAKRWDVTYGAGFEAQTGRPTTNCRAQESAGYTNCSPQGTSKPSFRVSADVTRINFRGTDQSLTLHTTYGLLERIATLSYNIPHLRGHENLTGLISGGYSNVQNITTFKASTLQGTVRVSQKIKRADTLIYDFTYRRVSVDQNSIQVTSNLIPLLSQPVRVGGPGITWLHDTRAPSPLDARRGHYFSVQEFVSNGVFGSQTDFNRVDMSHSSYYTWGTRRKYTFARNTRLGFENASGENPNASISSCAGILLTTNPSCNAIPLPERMYAGGASSHRGFGINSAGPRDLGTGYPVGGSAVFVNSFELRLPPPVLPVVGQSVSFVLFHDMGNTFLNGKDVWPGFRRFHQPNEATCRDASGGASGTAPGKCDFAYFSHAVGLGARYSTPVGPIRVDFSYNLNPTVYPIIDDYSGATPNHAVGQTPHFNFFFSIGQTF